ncbi:MAG: hypothetical protein FWF11_04760, partial [Coriobacteriia bacterium]|nr:hypothetical protein [Coriobacteriia bacterium]
MTAKRHVPKFAKREKLSNKRKFALLLAAVFLLTLPFLAAANSSLLQSVVSPLITQVQNVFSPAEPSSAVLGSDFSPASSSDLPPEALAISGGMNHTMAIRGDGTLWSWGRNISGRTGLDIDVGEQTTPAQVGTATNWSYVVAGNFQTHAIKDDGTLWSWGGNRDAATGLGTTVGAQWTPMQVGSDTDWTSVTAGQFHSHALKTDGTLWTWGLNAQGRNGMGLLTGSQLTPVQVGSDTNWKQVSAGGNHSLAVRLDGTLWSWGSN